MAITTNYTQSSALDTVFSGDQGYFDFPDLDGHPLNNNGTNRTMALTFSGTPSSELNALFYWNSTSGISASVVHYTDLVKLGITPTNKIFNSTSGVNGSKTEYTADVVVHAAADTDTANKTVGIIVTNFAPAILQFSITNTNGSAITGGMTEGNAYRVNLEINDESVPATLFSNNGAILFSIGGSYGAIDSFPFFLGGTETNGALVADGAFRSKRYASFDFIAGGGYDNFTLSVQVTDECGAVCYSICEAQFAYNSMPRVESIGSGNVTILSNAYAFISASSSINEVSSATKRVMCFKIEDGTAPIDTISIQSLRIATNSYAETFFEGDVEYSVIDGESASGDVSVLASKISSGTVLQKTDSITIPSLAPVIYLFVWFEQRADFNGSDIGFTFTAHNDTDTDASNNNYVGEFTVISKDSSIKVNV